MAEVSRACLNLMYLNVNNNNVDHNTLPIICSQFDTAYNVLSFFFFLVHNIATKVMYRGVSIGIIFSVISLYVYDLHIPDFSYGIAIDSLNLVCVLLLVVGSEVYHRVSLQDAAFETIYPEIENFFDDVIEEEEE
jgi:hypothetical protein